MWFRGHQICKVPLAWRSKIEIENSNWGRMKNIYLFILIGGLAGAGAQQPSTQQPPDQQPSLGDIARKFRSTKKPGNPVRVIDNDSISSLPPVQETKPTEAAAKDPAKGGDPKDGTKTTETQANQAKIDQWKAKLDAQKHEVALLQREFDVVEREARVRAANFYANPGDQIRDPAKFAEDTRKQQEEIDAKKVVLDAAKQKLQDLQDQARKDGVPYSVID